MNQEKSVSDDIVTIRPKNYEWPDCIPQDYRPKQKKSVKISRDYVISEFMTGATWEMLEQRFAVDKNTLKRYFYVDYVRCQALLKMSIIRSTVLNALEGKEKSQHFLCNVWLDMVEQSDNTLTVKQPDINEKEMNEQIKSLLDKMKVLPSESPQQPNKKEKEQK